MSKINVRIEYLIHTLVVNGSPENDISTEVNHALQKAIDTLDEKGSTVIINHLIGNFNVIMDKDSKGNPNLVNEILARAAQDNQSPSESFQTL